MNSRFLRLGLGSFAFALALAAPIVARARRAAAPEATASSEIEIAPPQVGATLYQPATTASDGTEFLVFGEDGRMQRVSSSGALLDPSVVPFPWWESTDVSVPSFAPNAQGYLAAWTTWQAGLYTPIWIETAIMGSDLAAISSQPLLIEETSVSVQVALDTARGSQGYLVAWSENAYTDTSNNALRGQLLDASGALLGAPFAIATVLAGESLSGPVVAFAGGQYLVAWGYGSTLNAARVTEEGVVLDTQSILLSTALAGSEEIVGGVSDFLIVWNDTAVDAGAPVLRATRIAPTGDVLDPDGITLPAYPLLSYSSVLGFTLAWQGSSNGAYTATLDESTGVVAPSGGQRVLENVYANLSLVSSGSETLLAWRGPTTDAQLLDANAQPTGTPVVLGDAPAADGPSTVACSGNGCLVAWDDGADVWARPTANDGTTTGPIVHVATFPALVPLAVAWTGSMYAIALGTTDVLVSRVKQDGTLVDASPQSISGEVSLLSLFGGGGRLVEITSDVGLTVSTFDETSLAPLGSSVFGGTEEGALGASGALLDATHAQVVWTDSQGLYAAQIDLTATNGAPASITLTSEAMSSAPALAQSATETAVAVVRAADEGIAMYRIDASGALLDGPFATGAATSPRGFSLASDGERYVLSWASSDGGSAYATDLDWGFVADPPIAVFTSGTAVSAPSIATTADGAALLTATRTFDGLTAIHAQAWSSTPLGPQPTLDGGIDAGDAGSGDDASDTGPSDAGDAAPPTDAAGSSDAAPPIVIDAGADAAAARDDSPSNDGGCSCRAAGDVGGGAGSPLFSTAIALSAFARRRRRSR